MDASFSIGIHILIMVSESQKALSSADIAQSAGINPSHVRKIAGLLREAGIIDSRQGRAGFSLTRGADGITLLDVYQAVYGSRDVELFPIHRNPSDTCIVGRFIRPTLQCAFASVGEQMEQSLEALTLASVIDDMRSLVEMDGARECSEASSAASGDRAPCDGPQNMDNTTVEEEE